MSARPRLERDYTISDEYNFPRRSPPHQQTQTTGQWPCYRQAQKPQEDHDNPQDYYELDKVAAAVRLEKHGDARRDISENGLSQQYSAGQRSKVMRNHEGQEGKITELATSPPLRGFNDARTTLPSSPQFAEEDESSAPGEKASRFATELCTISYLIIFSILGTLARLGLKALTFYPRAPVQTGVLWANFAGSLLMGFLLEDQNLFGDHIRAPLSDLEERNEDAENGDPYGADPKLRRHIAAVQKRATSQQQAAVKKTIPLYIGLATGFCGSFTSFSSFIQDAFLALSNRLPVPLSHNSSAPIDTVPRNGGYSFMAICAVVILTVVLCLGALRIGAHLATALERLIPRLPRLFVCKVWDRMIVLVAWTMWLGAILMTIWPPDRPDGPAGQASGTQEFWRGDALFALVFAPPGCLLRFYFSLHLNGRIQSFPLGTFAVNICGTALTGLFYDLQHVPLGGRVACQILQGLMDGFCGCLTTVSTWVVELKGLRIRHAYVYGSVSVGVGVGLTVIVMGGLRWTVGFQPSLCGHYH